MHKETQQERRNHFGFGIGTIGRDATYTMVSMYLMFYLTDIIKISTASLAVVTIIMMLMRVFDAVNDPIMGVIVDNTHSKYGKFKPWIAGGAILQAGFFILMFTDFELQGTAFLAVFTLGYILWEISFTANDIGFWSMLPALSKDQKEREKIGGFARICANIGMFAMVVGIVPITNWIGNKTGSMTNAYHQLAIGTTIIMLLFQVLMLLLVKEQNVVTEKQPTTTVNDMVKVIFKNDQLMWVTVSMTLFMAGYTTTTSFGIYYFKYVFGNENMYSIFALVLGISQIAALIVFPTVSRFFQREKIYLWATISVVIGYIIFYLAPTNTMIFIAIAGLLLFVGQAWIQLLMLMFITDTVEYGEWRFGQRNESVTLSLQSFINKLGGAIASGIVGMTLVISGMKGAKNAAGMTDGGLTIFKIFMMVVPLLFILIGYLIYHYKYKISAKFYQQILSDLQQRKGSNEAVHKE